MNSDHVTDGSAESIYNVLSHPKRRALLYELREVETTTVETAARTLVDAHEYRFDGGERSGATDQVKVTLHHVHLPKMEAAGVIDYDPEARTIEANDTTEEVYSLLDSISGTESG